MVSRVVLAAALVALAAASHVLAAQVPVAPRRSATEADRVASLPGAAPFGERAVYAGLVDVNSKFGVNLFYLFFEAAVPRNETPVVIWLQGGPGCSSLFGAFVENGPLLIDLNGTLSVNPHSWAQNAHMLYVEQPAGTGFSHVNNPLGFEINEATVAADMLALIQAFMSMHPQYAHQDLYIFGESYGGKYVPATAHYILDQGNPVNLKGIGLGDGWVDPLVQTQSYGLFASENKLISETVFHLFMDGYHEYADLVNKGDYIRATLLGNSLLQYICAEGHIGDVYDIRQKSDPTDPYSKALTTYLNRADVQSALHAHRDWKECDNLPDLFLIDDEARSVLSDFPTMLAQIRVLLYNGNKDLICNYVGTRAYTNDIPWPHLSEWRNATDQPWTLAGQSVGSFKSAATLTSVIIDNAGHMSPFDQPAVAAAMLDAFLAGQF